jgi:hypothetical protein
LTSIAPLPAFSFQARQQIAHGKFDVKRKKKKAMKQRARLNEGSSAQSRGEWKS